MLACVLTLFYRAEAASARPALPARALLLSTQLPVPRDPPLRGPARRNHRGPGRNHREHNGWILRVRLTSQFTSLPSPPPPPPPTSPLYTSISKDILFKMYNLMRGRKKHKVKVYFNITSTPPPLRTYNRPFSVQKRRAWSMVEF
jgi:hypothetical protein